MTNVLVTAGPVTEVVINRPQVRNALNTETINELVTILTGVAEDPRVEVVILTGAGDQAFCAGADLAEVRALEDSKAVQRYFANMAKLIRTLQTLPQPVIGAVFGHVLAGGMGLAAGVDLLVASPEARFGLPEVKVGLYPMVVTAPIARLIGPRRTLELGLTGRVIDAQTAYDWGFINRMADPHQALSLARTLAEEIRQGSPYIARLGKEGWRISQEMPMGEAMEALKSLVSLVALSEDSQEGVRAFAEKRRPDWPSQ